MSGLVLAGTSTDLRIGTDNTDAQDDALRQAFAVPGKNFLFNPSGEINQAGLASTADGAYDFDQWIVMTQTAAVTPSQVTDAEDGTPFMMRLTQAQASAQRMGRVQWIEGKFCKQLRGQAVVLSARVRMSASTTLRYAILSWTGTEDTITLDQVNDWTSGTYTAGNFFKNTTLTVEATGSIALTADTLTDITELSDSAISSSMNNLAVIFWTDSTQAQNVTLDIAKVKLEKGTKATAFVHPDWDDELKKCQRYWEKSYNYSVATGTVTAVGEAYNISANGSGDVAIPVSFLVQKRTTPTMAYWAPATGTSAKITSGSSGDINPSATGLGERGFAVGNGSGSHTNVSAHWSANARL